ncbi:hypothetical protein HanPI659440_Chr03g0123751 [Helianthus annuus]|nr:hypothetical protein HanPI659440_Chr03g0123751 [Helianthus annuus]
MQLLKFFTKVLTESQFCFDSVLIKFSVYLLHSLRSFLRHIKGTRYHHILLSSQCIHLRESILQQNLTGQIHSSSVCSLFSLWNYKLILVVGHYSSLIF